MIDPNEIEAIVAVVEARIHAEEPKKLQKSHWPRRIVLTGVVMLAAIITHKLIEHEGLAHFAQSAELGLAAMFDSLFSRAREV